MEKYDNFVCVRFFGVCFPSLVWSKSAIRALEHSSFSLSISLLGLFSVDAQSSFELEHEYYVEWFFRSELSFYVLYLFKNWHRVANDGHGTYKCRFILGMTY